MIVKTLQVRVETKRYCLYTHAHDGSVFYVGVGISTRPFERIKRNEKWYGFMADKAYFDVAILQWSDDRNELLRAEATLITELKPECNLLMNGYTNEARNRRASEVHRGKAVSEATRAIMSANSKARGNGWLGKTHSEEAKAKIRAHQPCYPIRCVETGVEYESIRDACLQLGISKSSVRNHLGGTVPHVRGMTFERVIARIGLDSLAVGAALQRRSQPSGSEELEHQHA